jgi:ABC-type nitrate/sulfonate/bicarbonate transport system ATPase subunit
MPPLYPYNYGETLLRIQDVNLTYGDHTVLRDVSAEIKKINRPGQIQGQIVGILGPSGMGKTQLFRIISGLNSPTSGAVYINGGTVPVRAGQVGVVAQSYPLFAHRTILGNLMLGARQKEKDSKTAEAKVLEMLNTFELADKKNLYPAQLSGGQKQRVAIIQQILCSDHFLLMDEPFSGLDIIMEDKTLELILKIANLDNLNTVIVVTHDVSAAASICDHLWLLGRDRDDKGQPVPGARIVKDYDLIEAGLCWEQWQGMAAVRPQMNEFIRMVKSDFYNL